MRLKIFDRSGCIETTDEPGINGKIVGVDQLGGHLWIDLIVIGGKGNAFEILPTCRTEFLREFGVDKPENLLGKSVYLFGESASKGIAWAIAAKPKTDCLTFTEFKELINRVDESRWGASNVTIGPNLHIVDLSYVTGLPACDNRFHGKQSATPNRIELVVVRPEDVHG